MQTESKKPNDQEAPLKEKGGILVEGHVKIFDPETNEEFLNKRDN